jgi:hypothetical protein
MKKQGVLISFLIFIVLSTQIHSQRTDSNSSNQVELEVILKKCAEYCEKLSNSVLDFVCNEKITEVINNLGPRLRGSSQSVRVYYFNEKGETASPIEKNVYIYDYQLIRKENKIRERRILLKENGKTMNEEDAQLKTKRFGHKHVVFGPVGLLSDQTQQYYDYKIVKEEGYKGEKVFVLEITPKPSIDIEALYGKAWVKKSDFSILKIEWNPVSIRNYEKIEELAKKLHVEPEITFVSEYDFEKNNIRFPNKYFVKEVYRGPGWGAFLKSETKVIYKKYKFFTVEWETKH